MASDDNDQVDAELDHEEDREWLLSLFVRIANAGKGSFGMTLWVGGAVVSGTLIGAAEFYDGIAEDFDQAVKEGSIGDAFRNVSASVRDDFSKEEDPVETMPPPAFIHFKNARTYSPGGRPIPENRGVWWRGRLDSVDAWCFGELRAEERPES